MAKGRWPLYGLLLACTLLVIWTEGPGRVTRDSLLGMFGASRSGLAAGRWWSLLTYALAHGSWWHALFNLAGLWVLGRHVIAVHGPAVFMALLSAGVLAGGLAQVALSPDGVLVGISGGVMALAVAAGLLWGRREVALRLGRARVFVLQGRHLGWGILLSSLACALLSHWLPDGGMAIGHWCHAGAATAGALAVAGAWLLAAPTGAAKVANEGWSRP